MYKIGDLVVNTMGYPDHLYGPGLIVEVITFGAFGKPARVRVIWSKSPTAGKSIHVKYLKHLDEQKREISS